MNNQEILEEFYLKNKYKITTSDPDDKNENVLQEHYNKNLKKEEVKEDKDWLGKGYDFVTDIFTGEKRTEFPKMKEITKADTSFVDALKLGTGFAINVNPKAQIDMVKATFPNAVISKDKFDNIMITLPKDKVNGNRTYYLNEPGLSRKDLLETGAQVLQYMPGANFVYRNIGGGITKKVLAQGGAAAGTGMTQDVASLGFGSKQGEGFIPIIEDSKLLFNLAGGAIGERLGIFLQRYNFSNNILNKIIPSKFNIFSGKGTYLNNKGVVTNETLKMAKRHFPDEKLLKNKTLLTEYAQALEDGINPSDAAQIVGANKFGISLWKAHLSNNKKHLKYLKDVENGVYGSPARDLVLHQKNIQLDQTFNYLNKYRESLLRNKKSSLETVLPGQKTNLDNTIDSITELIKTTKLQMDEISNAKFNAIDWTGKIKTPIVKNLTKNMELAIGSADGIGLRLNKDTMPNAFDVIKRIGVFANNITKKNIKDLNIGDMETMRRVINQAITNTKFGTDKKALMIIKQNYDDFFERSVNNIIASGKVKEVDKIIIARSEFSKIKKIFSAKGKNDYGGKFLNNVLNGEHSALQVADWLYGTSSLNANSAKRSTEVLKKLTSTIFKEGTEGFDLLVDGASQRMINNSFVFKNGRDIFDPARFIKEVEKSINGNGKEISKILFNKAQRDDLLSFAKQLNKTLNVEDFVDPAGGAKSFINVFRSAVRSLAGIAGFQVAGIQGTLTSRFTVDASWDLAAHNQSIKDVMEAIAFSKIPQASGGQGILQNFFQNINLGDDKAKQDAALLEKYGIIESLEKYR